MTHNFDLNDPVTVDIQGNRIYGRVSLVAEDHIQVSFPAELGPKIGSFTLPFYAWNDMEKIVRHILHKEPRG